MAADQTVESGQPLVVEYVFVDGNGAPLDLTDASVRFWARDLSGSTVLGGPAQVVGTPGAVAYEGVAPLAAGELFCRFTATFPDRTVTQPMPGGIVLQVADANPTRPVYAGIGDLEQALGRPIPLDQRGHAMHMLAGATVAIDNYTCRTFDAPIPDQIRLACAGMAADTFGQGASADGSLSGPVVRETIGDYSVQYGEAGSHARLAVPSVYGFEFMLKNYRLCGLGSISTIPDKTNPFRRRGGDYHDLLRPESDL